MFMLEIPDVPDVRVTSRPLDVVGEDEAPSRTAPARARARARAPLRPAGRARAQALPVCAAPFRSANRGRWTAPESVESVAGLPAEQFSEAAVGLCNSRQLRLPRLGCGRPDTAPRVDLRTVNPAGTEEKRCRRLQRGSPSASRPFGRKWVSLPASECRFLRERKRLSARPRGPYRGLSRQG